MNEQLLSQKEHSLLDHLIEARLEKIESLKQDLKNNIRSVKEESAILRELSGEIASLRELRQMQALNAAKPARYRAHGAGL